MKKNGGAFDYNGDGKENFEDHYLLHEFLMEEEKTERTSGRIPRRKTDKDELSKETELFNMLVGGLAILGVVLKLVLENA